MTASLSAMIQIGVDILKTVVDSATKSILAQTGDVQADASDADQVEWWQHAGFTSRPSQASSQSAAAQAITIKGGAYDAIIASRDLRGQELYGSLGDGETALYAAGADGNSQGRILIKDNGSINLVTTHDNTPSGKTTGLFVGPDSIQMICRWGMIVIDQDGINISTFGNKLTPDVAAGGSAIKLNNLPLALSQVQIATSQCQLYSDTCWLGKLATPVTNCNYSPIPVVSLPSQSVFISP